MIEPADPPCPRTTRGSAQSASTTSTAQAFLMRNTGTSWFRGWLPGGPDNSATCRLEASLLSPTKSLQETGASRRPTPFPAGASCPSSADAFGPQDGCAEVTRAGQGRAPAVIRGQLGASYRGGLPPANAPVPGAAGPA